MFPNITAIRPVRNRQLQPQLPPMATRDYRFDVFDVPAVTAIFNPLPTATGTASRSGWSCPSPGNDILRIYPRPIPGKQRSIYTEYIRSIYILCQGVPALRVVVRNVLSCCPCERVGTY